MKERRSPGFTAEQSLYRTSECYRVAGSPDALDGGGSGRTGLVAALSWGWLRRVNCANECDTCERDGSGGSCHICARYC
jgi:hypothetical protein